MTDADTHRLRAGVCRRNGAPVATPVRGYPATRLKQAYLTDRYEQGV